MNESVIRSTDYSVTRNDDTSVDLNIRVDRIGFVQERIPDGQMAGMMGHREVPCTDEYSFRLYGGQAQHLWEELGRVLGAGVVERER